MTPEPSLVTDIQSLMRLLSSGTVYLNTPQAWIFSPESDVRVCLMTNVRKIEDRNTWLGPAGVVATTVVTLLTADFHDALRLSAAYWHALFTLVMIGSVLLLIRFAVRGCRAPTVDDVVSDLKKSATKLPLADTWAARLPVGGVGATPEVVTRDSAGAVVEARSAVGGDGPTDPPNRPPRS